MSDVFSGAASKKSKPGYVKLREDVEAVRKLFARKSFKGRFYMPEFGEHRGEHEPSEKNFCGTRACLAGWLALASKGANGFDSEWVFDSWSGSHSLSPSGYGGWISQAADIYQMTHAEADDLFFEGFNLGLNRKLNKAMKIADAIEARSKK